MKRAVVGVMELGSLYNEDFLAAVNAGQKVTEEQKAKKIEIEQRKQEEIQRNNVNLKEIKALLKKAGIKMKDFPFNPVKGKNGEIESFIPKGKNEMEIKEDIMKYKEELQKALDNGKIDNEEFEKLNDNLEELMKENDIVLEEEKEENQTISDEEINDTLNAIIYRCFGDNYDLDNIKEGYEEASLDDKKDFLTKFNSQINRKLGIAGDIKFVNQDVDFENSFTNKGNGGYFLSTNDIDVEGKDLKNVLYGMVERSMIRKAEIKKNKEMSPEQKRALHEKILQDKEKREREARRIQDKENRKKANKLMRTMEKSRNI